MGEVRSVKHSTFQDKNGLSQNRRLFKKIEIVSEEEEIDFRARLYHEIGRPHDALDSIDALIALSPVPLANLTASYSQQSIRTPSTPSATA
jgi:hypothetical protein